MSDDEFAVVRDLINEFCGNYFRDDTRYVVSRRLAGRLEALGLSFFSEYCRYLRDDTSRQEIALAAELLTTNETYLFREPHQLHTFASALLPKMRERALQRHDKRLHIWSAGCASGEEAYTIAMLIDASGLFEGWDVRVFGNDLCRAALHRARLATYGSSSFRAMPAGYDRYFVEMGETKQVVSKIRDMCQFSHLNLMDGRALGVVGHADAIFCRNVLIYFDEASRKRVLEALYRRLVRGGFLLLGHSESLLHGPSPFEFVQVDGDLVYRRPLPFTEPPAASGFNR